MASTTRLYFICVVVLILNLSEHVLTGVIKGTPDHTDFNYVTRAEWGALPSTDDRLLNQPVPYIVVHHTYIPKSCYNLEECNQAMRSMQNYHNSLGWGDIGYSFCVGAEGSVFEGRGWDHKAIHAGSANNHSIGICMIGDWRAELPPQKSLESLKSLIKTGVLMGKVREDYKLIGHKQAMSTECPGTALMEELSTWDHFAPGKHDFKHLSAMDNSQEPVILKD